MNLSDTQEKARFGGITARYNLASHPDATIEILSKLINDSNVSVSTAAATNKNIDDSIFKLAVDKSVNREISFYANFIRGDAFKKDWIEDYIRFLSKYVSDNDIALYALENDKLFSNDDEWLGLLDLIHKNDKNTSNSKLVKFWVNFFKYPKKNYSEKIILKILEFYGVMLNEDEPHVFNYIHRTPMETENILGVIYSITGDEKFLPADAKDIFLF